MEPVDKDPNTTSYNWIAHVILYRFLGGLVILVMLVLIHLILGG